MTVLNVSDASLAFGERRLWQHLDFGLERGEFVAVLGPNGTGKTSLVKAILGEQRLESGRIELLGTPVARGNPAVGYIPQHTPLGNGIPLRARDLVAFGLTGRRWGLPILSSPERRRVDEVLEAVGATSYADAPVADLSGGEQQRVRVAQSIAADPALLLCDEPLLSLDLAHQRGVSELIDAQRRRSDAAVLFVTHDINPILGFVDRVLYLAAGGYRIGTPDEVLRSDVLSDLYGTPVDVLTSRGRVVVIGDSSHDHVHHSGRGAA